MTLEYCNTTIISIDVYRYYDNMPLKKKGKKTGGGKKRKKKGRLLSAFTIAMINNGVIVVRKRETALGRIV